MKKIIFLFAGIIMMSACGENGKQETDNALQHQRDSLQAIIDSKDDELNDLMGTVTEVQDGIRRINEAEGRVTVAESGPESSNSRQVIKENLEYIQSAMQQNRELIAQLKEKAAAGHFKVEKLEKMIEGLEAQIEAQNQEIQELKAQLAEKDAKIASQGEEISNLNTNVSTLTSENEKKASTISQQDKDLNSAWFVYGTKSELKEQGILKSGDVLKSGNFNKDYFTKIDIRKTKNIKTYSKSAKLLTSHPSDSYSLQKNASGQYELTITSPTKFWSVSKYLVMQVK